MTQVETGRRIPVLLLPLLMLLLFLLPASASAEDGASDSDTLQSVSYTTWSNCAVSIGGTKDEDCRIKIEGNVTLNLEEGAVLNANEGISVTAGNTLTIEGSGTLNARVGPSGYAAIGGEGYDCRDAGTIIINGCTINAEGSLYAPGIGAGGYDFRIHSSAGTVIINGGVVNAVGGLYAAGIGGNDHGNGANVTINGGIINAATTYSGEDGRYGNGVAIGGGAGCESHGTLTLAPGIVVYAGQNPDPTEDVSASYAENHTQRYVHIGAYTPYTAPVTYVDENGEEQTVNCVHMEAASRNLESGWYAVTEHTEVGIPIVLSGDIRLVLYKDGTMTANKGIRLTEGSRLTIYGTGALTAVGEGTEPGIGGHGSSGITVVGGTVTATGGSGGGAGIGADFTILGGTVTATGRNGGAGIGGSRMGDGSSVTLNGGTLTATGSNGGAGIGAGSADGGTSPAPGTVTLGEGVTVYAGDSENPTADVTESFETDHSQPYVSVKSMKGKVVVPYVDENGVERSATCTVLSVGDTWHERWYAVTQDITLDRRITVSGDVNVILCEGTTLTAAKGVNVPEGSSLTIYGPGTLKAKGEGKTAGIGGSAGETSGTVNLFGGTITATGGSSAAGIGGGNQGTPGPVNIGGSASVTATGGNSGAGIGGGYKSSGGTVNIGGSASVTAQGNMYSAGIGGGNGGNGGSVTVSGSARVTAAGKMEGAGIGGGSNGSGGKVTIDGGIVTATGGSGVAGIGSGRNGSGGEVTLNGGIVTATGGGTSGTGIAESSSVRLAADLTVYAGDSENPTDNVTDTFVDNHSQRYVIIRSHAGLAQLPVLFVTPKGLTVIGDEAFAGCAAAGIYLRNQVSEIGSLAFADCAALNWVRIPASVTAIADDALSGHRSGLIIYGTAGSEAERFAAGHGIVFLPESSIAFLLPES